MISLNVTDKTGNMIAIDSVTDDNDLMIINKSGLTIRISLSSLRTMGRNTQGVSLIKLKDNDAIAAVSKIDHEEDEEIETIQDAVVNEDSTTTQNNSEDNTTIDEPKNEV